MKKWVRVRASDKLAFREDLQSDPTLTDLQKRMISVIARHWDNARMHAECSLSFIAAGAGTTKKMVHKYAATLAASGRVSIERKATWTESTLWQVNWWFRGSAWVRHTNGGKPVLDCREESPIVAHGESPKDAQGESPRAAQGSPPSGGPKGARPHTGAQRAPGKERKENPRSHPGFARWRIVHAEYEGDDADMFVAHMRSGTNRKFVLRCHIDSDAYDSINSALNIDGEDRAVGARVRYRLMPDDTFEFGLVEAAAEAAE